jgi:uncharacterized membrane protein YfcA
MGMDHSFLVAALMGCVSLFYATAGQAGGTAFVAVMAFAAFPAAEMRPTALLLNLVAASYATWSLHQNAAIDRKTLLLVTLPSMVAAFGGGLLVLGGQVYVALTGLLLVIAAALMIVRRGVDSIEAQSVKAFPAALTGVVGGVFLTPLIIAFGWASPKRAAALSPPFILCNSAVGLVGVLIAGQKPTSDAFLYAVAALMGAVIGSTIALHWMSERATRYVCLSVIIWNARQGSKMAFSPYISCVSAWCNFLGYCSLIGQGRLHWFGWSTLPSGDCVLCALDGA